MKEKKGIFVLKVNLPKIKGKYVTDEDGNRDYVRKYPEYVTEIDFQNQSYMAFVITDFMEQSSQYTVVFQEIVFNLKKAHNKVHWEKEDGLYSFTYCNSAQDMWSAMKGFVYQLIDARKTLLRKIERDTKSEWKPHEDDEDDDIL